MKTISAKAETVKRDWYVVDASNKTLGRAMYRKLKVYKGPDHPHSAQQPQTLDF